MRSLAISYLPSAICHKLYAIGYQLYLLQCRNVFTAGGEEGDANLARQFVDGFDDGLRRLGGGCEKRPGQAAERCAERDALGNVDPVSQSARSNDGQLRRGLVRVADGVGGG